MRSVFEAVYIHSNCGPTEIFSEVSSGPLHAQTRIAKFVYYRRDDKVSVWLLDLKLDTPCHA